MGQALPFRHLQRGGVETSFYSSDKKIFRLQPIDSVAAQELISDLIALYKRGMKEPLPFFPKFPMRFIRKFRDSGCGE